METQNLNIQCGWIMQTIDYTNIFQLQLSELRI